MMRARKIRPLMVVMVSLVAVSFLLSGCETLKRKFTRQKKKDKEQAEEFVPVLEPEEYPEKVYSVADNYKYHYSLWQVWEKELSNAVSEKESNKRQLYMLNQMIIHVDALKKLVSQENLSGLEETLNDLNKLESQIKRPAPMHESFAILKELRKLEKKMRDHYKFEKIEPSLITHGQ